VSALGGHALTMEAETIDISVHHQWVTLTGNVPWRGLESRAVQIASRVPGVRGVDDELTADDDLDTAVAGRLASDPRTRGERIHVSVRGGRATLEGTVQSAETARVAVEIARQVPGLRGVRSSLTVA
jgi:osmotically-inducible protein OsmY